ncbi:cyclic nucleotide-binding domain-containing protein [Hallerella porci]|uniref:CRP-like cAMP-binding protein n=1 Tax=Hallerella porci TaxID=1945871 RepID=A0ABX5LKI1_9BACT|nr:cyclic nucleotide-binding domain-containing protein [Hallerella porci]PWK94156.1 CRP-like cAMP-binding protein [Hallerella porci]
MKKLLPRDILFQEGAQDGKLYIVRKGELLIQKKEGSRIKSFKTLGPNSIIGEESLLFNAPHPFTLRATDSVEVEEISREDLKNVCEKLPAWFPPLLHFLAKHTHRLEENRKTIDKIHALPTLLFLCAKYLRKSEDGKFKVEPLTDDLHVINGLGYNETFELLRALCNLGIAEIIPGEYIQIHFYRKNLPQLLYRTLLKRKHSKQLPISLLSANDQTILTAFIAVAKTKGLEKQGSTFIRQKDFLVKYKELFPGIKLTHRSFENLVQCGYLFTVPEFSPNLDFKNIEEFYADKEAIKDLVELNRVYPLLDKQLVENL